MLAWLDKALTAWREPAPGLVVVLGAGRGELVAQLQALGAARVVLVEGHPDQAALLQRRVVDLPGFEVRAEVVSADGRELDWQLVEPARFAGPLRASGLQQHYPRLRQLGSRRVASRALPELLQELLDGSGEALTDRAKLLIFDLPGQEAALIEACDKPLMQRFDGVLLRGSAAALWEGAQAVDVAAQAMARRGFKARLVDRLSEPLWPLVELVVDQQKVEIERLQWRLERSQSELEQARARAANEQQLAEEQRSGREQAEQAARQASEELLVQRRARALAEQLADEHWQTIEVLSQERDAALQGRQSLEPELGRLRAELQALGEQLQHRDRQLESLQQALEAQTTVQQSLQQRLEAAEAEAGAQQQRADEACRRLQQMSQELVLAEGQLELVKDLLLGDPTL